MPYKKVVFNSKLSIRKREFINLISGYARTPSLTKRRLPTELGSSLMLLTFLQALNHLLSQSETWEIKLNYLTLDLNLSFWNSLRKSTETSLNPKIRVSITKNGNQYLPNWTLTEVRMGLKSLLATI